MALNKRLLLVVFILCIDITDISTSPTELVDPTTAAAASSDSPEPTETSPPPEVKPTTAVPTSSDSPTPIEMPTPPEKKPVATIPEEVTGTSKDGVDTAKSKTITGTFAITEEAGKDVSVEIHVHPSECAARPTTEKVTSLRPHESESAEDGKIKSCDEVLKSGDYKMYPQKPFEVTCDKEKETTCLKVPEIDFEKPKIELNKEMWLSQTSFNIQTLYNNLDEFQLADLISASVAVSQTIRLYSKTSVDYAKSLKALLRNDKLVASIATKDMPLAFNVTKCEDTDSSESGSDGEKWDCADVHLETNGRSRLPVTDLYIGDIVSTKPKVEFQLKELCFHRKPIVSKRETGEDSSPVPTT